MNGIICHSEGCGYIEVAGRPGRSILLRARRFFVRPYSLSCYGSVVTFGHFIITVRVEESEGLVSVFICLLARSIIRCEVIVSCRIATVLQGHIIIFISWAVSEAVFPMAILFSFLFGNAWARRQGFVAICFLSQGICLFYSACSLHIFCRYCASVMGYKKAVPMPTGRDCDTDVLRVEGAGVIGFFDFSFISLLDGGAMDVHELMAKGPIRAISTPGVIISRLNAKHVNGVLHGRTCVHRCMPGMVRREV